MSRVRTQHNNLHNYIQLNKFTNKRVIFSLLFGDGVTATEFIARQIR